MLSKYVCEFGNVVRGASKTKSFRIINSGVANLTISFDKKSLANTGFSIEPDRFGRIPGAPENEAVDVEVSFQSKVSVVFVCVC